MAKIFVSYRRQDSPYVAQALKDRLEQQFGQHSVFLDIDNIPIGVDFREHIDLAVRQCDVMLVLIGDRWLSVTPGNERNRLFDPQDFVRAEIEAALRRTIRIVPLLADNARMPTTADLPSSIQDLIYRNSAELRAGRDFNSQMTRLIEGLAQLFKAAEDSSLPTTPASITVPGRSDGATVEQSRRPVTPAGTSRASRDADDDLWSARGAVANVFDGIERVYIGRGIPDEKLQNALQSYPANRWARRSESDPLAARKVIHLGA